MKELTRHTTEEEFKALLLENPKYAIQYLEAYFTKVADQSDENTPHLSVEFLRVLKSQVARINLPALGKLKKMIDDRLSVLENLQ